MKQFSIKETIANPLEDSLLKILNPRRKKRTTFRRMK